MIKSYKEAKTSSYSSQMEKVCRKTYSTTFEAIERPFITKPKRYIKRGCHIVRDRSLKFISILKTKYSITYEIPVEQAKTIFQNEIDIWDRTSLKAYFGTQKLKTKRSIVRTAHYPRTGTVSYKTITLTQDIPRRGGYLEKLNLVSYEERGNVWFMLLIGEPLVSEISRPPTPPLHESKEGLQVSIDNFSLTPKPLLVDGGVAFSDGYNEIEKRESYRVREKSEMSENTPNNELCCKHIINRERRDTDFGLLTPAEERIIRSSMKEKGNQRGCAGSNLYSEKVGGR